MDSLTIGLGIACATHIGLGIACVGLGIACATHDSHACTIFLPFYLSLASIYLYRRIPQPHRTWDRRRGGGGR